MLETPIVQVHITRTGDGLYQGRVFDHPVGCLPSQVSFRARETPSRPTPEGPRVAFMFETAGCPVIGNLRSKMYNHFADPILLAMVVWQALKRNWTPPEGPLKVPYAPPDKLVFRPLELALRLNGVIS